MKNRLSSLPLQLLAFVVLPLLVLLMVVAFGGVALHQAEMRDMLVDHNRQIVAGAAASLSEQLAQRQRALIELAATVENEEQAQTALGNRLAARVFDGASHSMQPTGICSRRCRPHRMDRPCGMGCEMGKITVLPLYAPGKTCAGSYPTLHSNRAHKPQALCRLMRCSRPTSDQSHARTAQIFTFWDRMAMFYSDPIYVGQHFDDDHERSGVTLEL
jgi:hypothetical protein